MKKQLRTLLTLLLVAFTLTAFSQDDAVIVIGYMKVKPGESGKYLELEKEWKKIHEARLEKGFITGWQLWEKMYAGAEDEYHYIVIEWYENFHKTSPVSPFSLFLAGKKGFSPRKIPGGVSR